MHVVSYYTPTYLPEANRLVASLRRLGLPASVIGVADQGDWYANTQLKPIFLRHMLQIHRGPVLWVDADAVVWEWPTFFTDLEGEVSPPDVSVFQGRTPGGQEVLLSGTVWFNHTPAAFAVLDAWIAANAAAPRAWDQRTLQEVLARADAAALRIRAFPARYCHVFDIHRPSYGIEPGEPAIEHFQASRRLKVERADRLFPCATGERPAGPPVVASRPLRQHPDLPRDLAEVFVVGGGPSLAGLDWRRLDFRFTIAVNRAWEALPAARVLFTAEERVKAWFAQQAEWQAHPGLKVALDRGGWAHGPGVWTVPAADDWPGTIDGGIPDAGAGLSAVALALAMGARRVWLLGFDSLDPRPGRSRHGAWHGGFPWPTRERARIDEMERLFRSIAPGRVRFWDEQATHEPETFTGEGA